MHVSEVAKTRFWAKVDKTPGHGPQGECWLWMGWRDKDGYGGVKIEQRSYRAARIAYVLTYGYCPDGLLVCHHCDKPPCVNPDHLFLGTSRTNRHDCISKGRTRPAVGEKTGGAKLSETDVLKMLELYRSGQRTQYQLSREFNIGQSQVSGIVRGQAWKHLGQGRGSFEDRRVKRGTSHYLARLTEVDVLSMPELYKTHTAAAIAEKFKVSKAHVMKILEGRTWKHLKIREVRKRLTPKIVRKIRRLYKEGNKAKDIANLYGVSVGTIHHIARGFTWGHVK